MKLGRPLLLALLLAGSWHGGVLHAATLTVAPGQSLRDTLRRATDGDVIEIVAGAHHGQVGVIEQRRLTLRGVGGRPVLFADGQHAEGKAMLVVRNGDVHIDNLEFRGVRVPDGNGAGIRFERGRLRVTRCAFIDNQNGILTANFRDAELTVQDSEFAAAPAGTSLPHLLYVGRIARLTLSGSRFSGGNQGHLVKSRAREHHVFYNQLVDGPEGQAAYELEFPNGGLAWVVGNVIGQSPRTSNPTLVSFGAEGSDDREQGLFMAHNTLVNDGLRPGLFVRVHELAKPVAQQFVNNLAVGLGLGPLALADPTQGNFSALPAVLQDMSVGLYALSLDSMYRGLAVPQGTARGVPLQPAAEFTPPAGTRPISPRSRWSPGAFQD
ncbi:MAG: hypothetical protein KA141_08785 [Rubrivivax sp.]|nr:hypothetical protein [Rubrivivax sp.]